MLEWMQKHKKYLVVTVWVSALALVFASMVEWGGGGFSSVSSDSVAKVGDIYISNREYQRKYNEVYDNIIEYMRQLGVEDNGMPIPEIEQEAFRVLVQEKLMEMLAKDLGVIVTPNEILEIIIKTPEFQDARNVFDRGQYESVLHANRWTTESYETFVSNILLQEKMQNFPIVSTATLENNSFMSAGKIRDFVDLKLFNRDSTLKNVALGVLDSEIRAYWEKNKGKYSKPARYDIAYIALDTNSVELEQHALDKFYKDNVRKYNNLSFEQVKADIEQDYKKAILGLVSSYMATKIKDFKEIEEHLDASDVIITMESKNISLFQKHFDMDLDIQDITLQDAPIHRIQLDDDGINYFTLVSSIADGHGLLAPLEYSKDHWIVPYIIEKHQKQPLAFEMAKESVEKDLMEQKQTEEFKNIMYSKLTHIDKEVMDTSVSLYLSLLQERDNASYKQLLDIGLNDFDIRESLDYIMKSSKRDGVVFIGNDKALLFKIVRQDMPTYEDFVSITNAEDEALQESKIRDLRSAMLEYAMKRYKVIDYRRQN